MSTSESPIIKQAHNISEQKEIQSYNRNNKTKPKALLVAIFAILIVGIVIVSFILGNKNKSDINADSLLQTSETTNNINIIDYVGYWHINGNREAELTILNTNNDTINFSLFYSKEVEFSNISATLQDNIATFSLAVDGSVVKGNLTFEKDTIIVNIVQSTLESLPTKEMSFTEQHMSSLVTKEEERTTTDDEIQTDSPESQYPNDDYFEDSTPSMNEVPYLISVEANIYAIYKSPTYYSDYIEMLPKGTFTIVEEKYDENNNLWGKLKSGLGWICIANNNEF